MMKFIHNAKERWSSLSPRHRGLVYFTVLLLLCFSRPVVDLIFYACTKSMYSHILLIPFISLYLGLEKKNSATQEVTSSCLPAVLYLGVGLAAVVAYVGINLQGLELPQTDRLALLTFSLVVLFLGGVFVFLGKERFRSNLFPYLFLFLMIPIPEALKLKAEVMMQHASADASYAFLQLLGTPVFREGTLFRLPNLVIEVARECSGIRSTLVLFITSLLAGHMFLKTGWKKIFLALFTLPIAIARNALRIVTISLLTIYVDPGIIDGPLHKRGGPVFFLISLVPLFMILMLLWKTEPARTMPNKLMDGGPGDDS